jgi:hypothetical protein
MCKKYNCHKKFCILRYNTVQRVEVKPMFRRNKLPASSGSKHEPTEEPACKHVAGRLCYRKLEAGVRSQALQLVDWNGTACARAVRSHTHVRTNPQVHSASRVSSLPCKHVALLVIKIWIALYYRRRPLTGSGDPKEGWCGLIAVCAPLLCNLPTLRKG